MIVRDRARWRRIPPSHQTDGQKLTELGHRAQRGYSRIEVRARAELHEFLRVFHPVRYRHKAGNPQIAGDVEHPDAASGFAKLSFQITNVGIVELAEIHLRALQTIVPPDGV